MIPTENLTDEEAGELLDEFREESLINDALLTLGQFVLHTLDNHGKVTPETAMFLAEAAERTVTLLLDELRQEQTPIEDMPALGNA